MRVLAPLFGVIAFIGATILFSVLILVGAGLALGIWGWLWWRARRLHGQGGPWPGRERDDRVIEGEYTVHEPSRLPPEERLASPKEDDRR